MILLKFMELHSPLLINNEDIPWLVFDLVFAIRIFLRSSRY